MRGPDTWERFRYLVFAEQFGALFRDFRDPLADIAAKWADAERVLAAQFVAPGWLLVAIGAAVVAARSLGTFAVFAAVRGRQRRLLDELPRRRHRPLLHADRRRAGAAARRRPRRHRRGVRQGGGRGRTAGSSPRSGRVASLAGLAGAIVLGLGALLPAASLVTGYDAHDQSQNRDADAWVASVHALLPPNAVVVSWWSYSTPLWHHRWVLGRAARPHHHRRARRPRRWVPYDEQRDPRPFRQTPGLRGASGVGARERHRALGDEHGAHAARIHPPASRRGTSHMTDPARPRLTFFFPAYNEEENLAETVQASARRDRPAGRRLDRGPRRGRWIDRPDARAGG